MSGQEEQQEQEPGTALEQFTAWIEADYDYERLSRGEIREAKILQIDDAQVVVDLGVKRDGIILQQDLEQVEASYREGLKVGDTVPVSVVNASDEHDTILVSLRNGLAQQDWLRAEQMLENGETAEAEVMDTNRGGVVVAFGRVRGFVPNSHLTSVRRGLDRDRLREAKSALVGKTLHLSVIEVNQKRRRLVLSERVAKEQRREEVMAHLTPGDQLTGVVCNIVSYGAFVDLGGVDGLIHISELDWQHVGHPSEVVQPGDEVEVYVLSVDHERNRIALSRKRLLPDPWPLVMQQINEGDVIQGTITNTVDFGAFVDVGEGIEGLVHISQIPGAAQALQFLARGQEVMVRVLRIDNERQRISLALEGTPEQSPLDESSQENT
ncbi:MAG: S1 RNA-binding domain-containing protein [Anaerolineae bacterium]|nr:S1 RNA-binding domain-containing protein [Anaerolineae bacterium]